MHFLNWYIVMFSVYNLVLEGVFATIYALT